MKEKFLKRCSLIMSLMLCIGLMAGCGNNATQTGEGGLTKLTWYLRPTAQDDLPLVQDAVNEILGEKIQAELEIVRVDPAAYAQKLKTLLASNEAFDLMHISGSYGYYDFARKGALKNLDELLPQYAPETYKMVPAAMWDATRVGGSIYGAINYQIVARQYGFYISENMVNKYNFDYSSVKKLEDIEPLLKQIEEGEPSNIVPLGVTKGGYWQSLATYYGIEYIGDNSLPGAVYIEDDTYKVFNQYDSPEFKNYLTVMRDFYQKGYIKADAATTDNQRDFLASGNAMCIVNPYKPGGMIEIEQMLGGNKLVYVPLSQPFATTNSTIATMTSVSASSENPEKAVQLIELLNTDKELYNLFCYGIEGKHYNKVSENRIEQIPNSGYSPNVSWMFGCNFNAYLLPSQEDGVWEETIELNNSSKASNMMGFDFDSTPVKMEIAQCSTVVDEFLPSLVTGSVDYEGVLEEFLNKLEVAGSQKIVDEKQRQLNEWLATREVS